jgi:predicted DsbA family dithiol-disulfide isomerase
METAREKLGLDFVVEWKPYFLDPTLPKSGKDKTAHYDGKFGEARCKEILLYLRAVFEAEGIPGYNINGLISNTIDSHQLLELAREHSLEAQDRLAQVLFRRYFIDSTRDLRRRRCYLKPLSLQSNVLLSQPQRTLLRPLLSAGEDIGDRSVLLAAAKEVAIDEQAAAAVLDEDRYAEEVLSHAEAEMSKVRGIPLFRIDSSHQLSGGQSPEAFLQVFTELSQIEVQ